MAREQVQRVIFLDIDGVLNSSDFFGRRHATGSTEEFGRHDLDPTPSALVQQLCHEAEAHIVISSVWRLAHRTTELRELLETVGIAPKRVIGCTPQYPGPERERGTEIKGWMEVNSYIHDIESYVVIDDNRVGGGIPNERLVLTKTELGFRPGDYQRALRILRTPLGY